MAGELPGDEALDALLNDVRPLADRLLAEIQALQRRAAAGVEAADDALARPRPRMLGVTVLDVPARDAAGVTVAHVLPGSRAESMGLQPGDVILAINGRRVAGAQALSRPRPTTRSRSTSRATASR